MSPEEIHHCILAKMKYHKKVIYSTVYSSCLFPFQVYQTGISTM